MVFRAKVAQPAKLLKRNGANWRVLPQYWVVSHFVSHQDLGDGANRRRDLRCLAFQASWAGAPADKSGGVKTVGCFPSHERALIQTTPHKEQAMGSI